MKSLVVAAVVASYLLFSCPASDAGSDCGGGTTGGGATVPGEIECPPLQGIMGPVAVPGAGAYRFTDPAGWAQYSWKAVGTENPAGQTGVSFDAEGVLTVDPSACGSYRVTATNACGAEASMIVRIDDPSTGHWVEDPGKTNNNCCHATGAPVPGCDDPWFAPCYCVASPTSNPSPPREIEYSGGERVTKVYGCMMCCIPQDVPDCSEPCGSTAVFACGGLRLADDPMGECTTGIRYEAVSSVVVEKWVCR